MDYPLKLRKERSGRIENIFHPATIRQNISAPGYGLDKLDLGHSNKPLILELVNLGHHGAVEAEEYIALEDQRSGYSYPLNYRFELSQAHEGLISGLNFHL